MELVMTLPADLLRGYASFRTSRFASESERYRRLAETQQRPATMIIACSDSRAAPELIFDAGPGELFVIRNVANLVPPYAPDGRHHSTSAALEFAVLQLGVRHIVVMGHGRCGGIAAVVSEAGPLTTSDFIGQWMSAVRDVAAVTPLPASCSPSERLTLVERASVEHSLANLRTFPWVRLRETRKELSLHGAWFDIGVGELHVYDEQAAAWTDAPA
jgi:carbonic anhydrase